MANNLGDQILKTVDEILDSGNFEKLNSVVSDTVYLALDEARKQLEKATNMSVGHVTTAKNIYRPVAAPRPKMKRVGKVASVLFQVFGGIGIGIFGLVFLGLLLGMVIGEVALQSLYMTAIFLWGSAWMLRVGIGKRARLKRAERYIQLMQGKAYNNINELALLANKSESYVRKDLRKMIEIGIFPEGHLNTSEDCFIMGDVAYREFIRMEKSRKAVQAEIEKQKRVEAMNTVEEQKTVEKEPTENAELAGIIQEGTTYIKQLRDLNDLIGGEVISTKLFHLENILKEIFDQLKEHPEQMPEMHKFMEYYLPTTLKLVTAYEEFDRVSVPGEDILASKREIEKTLETINMAFEELLNKLFRSRVFDVTTDAQVLKTMLAREGLTREPVFVSRKEGKDE